MTSATAASGGDTPEAPPGRAPGAGTPRSADASDAPAPHHSPSAEGLPSEVDVAVVGAGYAGLAAARQLTRSGLRVAVLEARDRVGGRTLTERSTGGWPLDLGGQWVGPGQDRIAALAVEYGVGTVPTPSSGDALLVDRGRANRLTWRSSVRTLDVTTATLLATRRLDRLASRVDPEQPWTAHHAREHDAVTVATWLRRAVPLGRPRRVLEAAVGEAYAADVDRVSMLDLLLAIRSAGGLEATLATEDGAQQDMLAAGADAVARAMAAELGEAVRLEAPVTSVRQDATGAIVAGPAGEVRARRVIVALPPALAGRLRYDPAMPAARDQLTQRVAMGSVLKALAVYDRPFWRDAGLSGEVTHVDEPRMSVLDGSHPGGPAVLVALVTGRSAHRLGALTDGDRREALLAALARAFGPAASAPVEWRDKHWDADPWSRGGYSGLFPPGALTSVGPALRAPVGRVHWAGTETATRWYGYIDGAIRSGERAAQEVLVAPEPADSTGPDAGRPRRVVS